MDQIITKNSFLNLFSPCSLHRIISNYYSNWAEWSTIQGVIVRVNSKSDEREADLKLRARLLPELYDTRSNY